MDLRQKGSPKGFVVEVSHPLCAKALMLPEIPSLVGLQVVHAEPPMQCMSSLYRDLHCAASMYVLVERCATGLGNRFCPR